MFTMNEISTVLSAFHLQLENRKLTSSRPSHSSMGNLKNVNSRLSIIDCELESIFKSLLSKQCLKRIHESSDEKPD